MRLSVAIVTFKNVHAIRFGVVCAKQKRKRAVESLQRGTETEMTLKQGCNDSRA